MDNILGAYFITDSEISLCLQWSDQTFNLIKYAIVLWQFCFWPAGQSKYWPQYYHEL